MSHPCHPHSPPPHHIFFLLVQLPSSWTMTHKANMFFWVMWFQQAGTPEDKSLEPPKIAGLKMFGPLFSKGPVSGSSSFATLTWWQFAKHPFVIALPGRKQSLCLALFSYFCTVSVGSHLEFYWLYTEIGKLDQIGVRVSTDRYNWYVTNVTPFHELCFPVSWWVRIILRCGIGGPGQFPHSDQQLDQLHRIAKHRGRFESPLVSLQPALSTYKLTAPTCWKDGKNSGAVGLGMQLETSLSIFIEWGWTIEKMVGFFFYIIFLWSSSYHALSRCICTVES